MKKRWKTITPAERTRRSNLPASQAAHAVQARFAGTLCRHVAWACFAGMHSRHAVLCRKQCGRHYKRYTAQISCRYHTE